MEEYLDFCPNTDGVQRIAWVGTLMAHKARVWHQAGRRALRRLDNWQAYQEAIQEGYGDLRGGADAHSKMWALRYKNDIKSYLTTFRALNLLATATGEPLHHMVDQAMLAQILTVQFSHTPGLFREDEPFLHATYKAGRHVERLRALLKSKEGTSRGPGHRGFGSDQKEPGEGPTG